MLNALPQYKALNKKGKRYFMVRGGRGSAKSVHLAAWLVFKTYEDHNILFTRYTMTSAKDSIIPSFMRIAEMLEVDDVFRAVDSNVLNRYNDSIIRFRGIKTSSGNQTGKLKSLDEVSIWVCDEADEIPDFETFEKIDLSIRSADKENIVVLVFNTPDTDHWIYEQFYDEVREDTEYIYTTYLDNKHNLAQSFLDTAERTKRKFPKRYKKTYLGEWMQSDDLVFPKGFQLYCDDDEPKDELDKVIYGGDFGYTHDPNVIVRTHAVGNNLYLREVLRETNLDPVELAEKVVSLGIAPQLQVWDSADKGSIKVLKRKGIRAVPANKGSFSVYPQLEYLQRFNILIHQDSKALQKEFRRYKWAKDGDKFVRNGKNQLIPEAKEELLKIDGKEVYVKDHGIDAVRYARSKYTRWDS